MGTLMIRIVSVTCIGLLSGAMFEEYFVLRHVLAHLDGATWGAAHAGFGAFHPRTVIPLAAVGTVTVIVAAALERPRRSIAAILTWIVAAIALVVGALTMGAMFPVNQAIEGWAQTGVPADWQPVRDGWLGMQAARAGLSVAGFVLLVVVSLLPSRSATPCRSPDQEIACRSKACLASPGAVERPSEHDRG